MNNFDQLQALWNQQSAPTNLPAAKTVIEKAEQSQRQMRAIHLGTMLILGVTVLALAVYFWAYDTTTTPPALLGSTLMMGSLLLRIGVEYGSYRLFTGINLNTDLRTCLARTRLFHRVRQGVQWVVPPLCLGSYVWGFTLLLPYVRAAVSNGFYWYIITSGLVFLGVLCFIIYRQISQEMRLLAQLEESYATLLNE